MAKARGFRHENLMKKFPWIESFHSLNDAISRLEEAVVMPLDEHRIIIDATIQRFEFTFELFWKTLKRFMFLEGVETKTPRETLKKAYQFEWIDDEEIWLNMLADRNEMSHVYDDDKAKEIFAHIQKYAPIFRSVFLMLSEKLKEE